MKKIKFLTIVLAGILLSMSSCVKDLDTIPLDEDVVTSAQVFDDTASYKQFLAKCYAGLALSGQQNSADNLDISGIDGGFGQYLRAFFYHQEFPTDEALIGWGDQTIADFHYQTWASTDIFISAMYYRVFYQICLANEFIRETTDAKLSERGVSGALLDEVKYYRAEVRFLRALSYWHAIDLFGTVPFVTENDPVGSFFPQQQPREYVFNYIESELLEIQDMLMAPRTNEYGRADQAAAWTLLAKLYLNAEVYVGQNRYADCATYCEKVINAGFTLEPEYKNLFLADNHNCDNEIIFPIVYDGNKSWNYGGTTFIICSAIGGSMVPSEFGVASGWAGTRTTKAFVKKFYPDIENQKTLGKTTPKETNDYPVLYMPGSHQGWDPTNVNTVVASVNSDGHYEGFYFFPAASEFKFTDGPAWDVNYGDNDADGLLDADGANIMVAEEGVYKVEVNMTTEPRSYTLTKINWGVIGSATPGQWDTDTDMEYVADQVAPGALTVVMNLTAGEFKFRANDAWDMDFGDNEADGILEYGGANIVVETAGKYLITLNLGAPDYTYSAVATSIDSRAMFYTEGQSLDIETISTFEQGYAITKFKNIDRNGNPGSYTEFADTDFPLFRLGDVYLMYAEAQLRGAGGNALEYVNKIRERAYGNNSGNITESELTLDFILDERARELYWECHRRTDLIRFGQFTNGTYHWPWKGNVAEGIATSAHRNIYPIPASDLGANPNLVQNPGY